MADNSPTIPLRDFSTGAGRAGLTVALYHKVDAAWVLFQTSSGEVTGFPGVYKFSNVPWKIYKLWVNGAEYEPWGGPLGKGFGSEITSDSIVNLSKTLSALTDVPNFLGQIARYNSKSYIGISLTGPVYWETLSSVVVNPSHQIQNAYTPNESYKHTRGDSEYVGNATYSALGLMNYETLSETVFRSIKVRAWIAQRAAVTVKVAIVAALPATGFSIPSGDVIFTRTYTADEFNYDTTGFMTIDCGASYHVPEGYTVLVFLSCLTASTLYIPIWTTAAGVAPERHPFALTNSADPIVASNWAISSVPLYGAAPFILQSETKALIDLKYNIPVVDTVLPNNIFIAVDRQLLIWWKNLIDSKDKLSKYTFDVTCSVGANYEDYFAFTPSGTGTYPLTIKIVDEYGTVVKTVVSTINAVSKTAGSGTKRILCLGDSTMRGTGSSSVAVPTELNTLVTADGGITGTFIGLRDSYGTANEGIPGFRISDFSANPGDRPTWKFTVSGVTVSPVPDLSEYTNNSSTFICRHLKISGGSGYIVMERKSGSNAPLASGTLTKGTGTGDGTITFSAIATASANPIWDVANSRLSFQYYITEFGLTGLDIAVLNLGINDLISTSVYSSYTTYINQLKALVDGINHATYGYPSAKIIINLQSYCGDTVNGLATNYGTAYSVNAYKKNMRNFWKAVIDTFETTVYNANVFLAIGGIMIDRDAGYPKTTGNRTARDTTQVSTHSNGVHPNDLGYKYHADAIYSAIRKALT